MRALDRGEDFVITRNGTPVGELHPYRPRLYLEFEDGAKGVIDFSTREWRGVFAPLADQAQFERVKLDEKLGTIVWPNGADMAPETLYFKVTNRTDQIPV